MTTSPKQYAQMNKQAMPKTKSLKNCICAFTIGGFICLLGQILSNLYIWAGLSEETAKLTGTVTLVFISAVLTLLGYYDSIARFAGAGTLVPITGFANSVVSPAIEFKKEGFILGMGAKMFTIAGPVLVFGISSGVVYGVILYLIKIL